MALRGPSRRTAVGAAPAGAGTVGRVARYVLALDQGTSSSRAVVFDLEGQVVAFAQTELTARYPRSGWVEQDPEEIWSTQLETARAALARAGIDAAQLAAIGIANQRETAVLWERASGRAVGPAIVWQDRRTASLCASLKARGLEPLFTERTGLPLDPYFSGTKLHWLLRHHDGLRQRAEAGELAFGTVDSWLLYRLTSGAIHATDITNASRTLLCNIRTLDWDEELLRILQVPRAVLPQVVPSAGLTGTSHPPLLGNPVPITAVAGDQQASLFGQACLAPGQAKNTYGTGAFLLAHTGEDLVRAPGLLTSPAWQLQGERPHYALEAPVFVAGAAVQWLRDGLGLIARAEEIEALAAAVPDSGGLYFVPALTGLGAPHWDPLARGLIIGITRGTERAHLARATLEAIAFSIRDGLEAMQRAGLSVSELRVDGGAARNDLLLQIQADLSGVPVLRPVVTETTAFGAAALAAVGAGLWSAAQVAERWRLQRRFQSRLPEAEREQRYAGWQRALARSQGWAT